MTKIEMSKTVWVTLAIRFSSLVSDFVLRAYSYFNLLT